jgi:hypothetical protein
MLTSKKRGGGLVNTEWHLNGFRVASIPEPTTCTLALAALCLAISRRRGW